MNILSKSSNKAKNIIKKIIKFAFSRILYVLIGLFLSITISVAYAAWNTTVSDGDHLTAAIWNEHVNKLIDLDSNLDSNWKMLASGSDWTEEALITLTSAGPSFTTDAQYSTQRVNIGTFRWPTDSVSEIIFKVFNRGDDYCAGGKFTMSLGAGGGVFAKCQDFRYQGSTLTRVNILQGDGIKIAINGVDMDYCPDQYGKKSNSAAYPGTYGHPYHDTICYYRAGNDYGSSNVTKIEVKEVDWSGSFGTWRWEIWYR